MNIRRLHRSVVKSVCLLGLAILFSTVLSTQSARAEAGQAFSISPPLIELKADPGQTVNASIKFTNVSSGELLIKTQFNDFGAKNETGEPNIIFDDSQNTTYSLRNWIASPQPFKIASKETKTLKFPIVVPKDAEPGGHYAVIRFTGTAPDLEQSGVSLTGSIGSLVLLQVSGDIKEDAKLTEFSPATVTRNATGEPVYTNSRFFEYAPVGFTQRIQNAGNVHIKPTGTIDIHNMFGAKVATVPVNGNPTDPKNPPKSILPQSARRFGQDGANGWMFGRYTATINLSYGQGQKQLTQSVDFWVIPYKLIILVIVAAVALFFAARMGIRRYNQYIIGKAGGNNGQFTKAGPSKLKKRR